MKKKKVTSVIIVAVLLLVIGGIAAYSLLLPKDVPAVTVSRGSVSDTYTVTGVYGKDSERIVFSEVDGEVVDVKVTVNDAVKKGDVIAVMSDRAIQSEKAQAEAQKAGVAASKVLAEQEDAVRKGEYAAEIAELENQLGLMDAQYRQALMTDGSPAEQLRQMDINLHSLREQRSNYKKNYDDYKDTYESLKAQAAEEEDGNTTEVMANVKKAMDEMESEALALEGQIDEGYAAWNALRVNIDYVAGHPSESEDFDYSGADLLYKSLVKLEYEYQRKSTETRINYLSGLSKTDTLSAAIDQLDASEGAADAAIEYMDERIESCTIKAPCDGVITSLPIEKTNFLTAGDEACGITPVGTQLFVCDVLTDYADGIKEGDPVSLSRKKGGVTETFGGIVESIFDYAIEGVSSLGLAEYRVRVLVQPDDGMEVRNGGNADATFTTYKSDGVLYVPVSALITGGDTYSVYRIKGSSVEKVPVQLGYRSNEVAEIKSGLNEGDVVAKNANMEGLDEDSRVTAVFE